MTMIPSSSRSSRSSRYTMTFRSISYYCILLLLLSCEVHGFPNNLIMTRTGCMTELDTSEVIMNNVIKSAEESDFPKMHLAVVVDENHMESPYHYTTTPTTAQQQESSSSLTIAFVNPYTRDEFPEDLQFIMQVEGPGEFITGGSIGCDGNQRVAARFMDENGIATLKIKDASATFKVWAGWATGYSSVRLTPVLLLEPASHQAAVAPEVPEVGDEPKKDAAEAGEPEITKDNNSHKKTTKKKKSNGGDPRANGGDPRANGGVVKGDDKGAIDNSEPKTVDAEEQRKMAHLKQKRVEEKHKKPKDNQKIKVRNKKEFMDTAKKLKESRKGRNADGGDTQASGADLPPSGDNNIDNSNSEDEELEPLNHRNDISDEKNFAAEQKRRKELEAQMTRNFGSGPFESFQRRYLSDDFANRLDMRYFLYACAFFVFSIGAILIAFGKRREKGRRDL